MTFIITTFILPFISTSMHHLYLFCICLLTSGAIFGQSLDTASVILGRWTCKKFFQNNSAIHLPQEIKFNIYKGGNYKIVEKDNSKERWQYRRWVTTGSWQLTDCLLYFSGYSHDSKKRERLTKFTGFNYILFKELSNEGTSYYVTIIRLNPNEMELFIPALDSKLLFRKHHFIF